VDEHKKGRNKIRKMAMKTFAAARGKERENEAEEAESERAEELRKARLGWDKKEFKRRFNSKSFGHHEALDRANLFHDMVSDFENHPAIVKDPVAYGLVRRAANALWDTYQYMCIKEKE
jgi:hypothetical protein